jgi:hypothetical protein
MACTAACYGMYVLFWGNHDWDNLSLFGTGAALTLVVGVASKLALLLRHALLVSLPSRQSPDFAFRTVREKRRAVD